MEHVDVAGRSLARSVARLKPAAMRGFISELAKVRHGMLEDLADVIVSLRRRRQPHRSYRQFWGELSKSRNT